MATPERHTITAHVAGDALAPEVLNALFYLAVAQFEMNPKPPAFSRVNGAVIHCRVI
jgi:hypothetical protein